MPLLLESNVYDHLIMQNARGAEEHCKGLLRFLLHTITCIFSVTREEFECNFVARVQSPQCDYYSLYARVYVLEDD
jgi:hypothetical protein